MLYAQHVTSFSDMSSAPITKEKLEELLQCSLCLDTFKSPQALKCLHTLCKTCLESLSHSLIGGRAGYNCPQCRSFTSLKDVTNNFHMKQLVELYQQFSPEKVCFECESSDAEWKCRHPDCNKFYCTACKDEHVRPKSFRHHDVIHASDIKPELVLSGPVFCKHHKDIEVTVDCNCVTCEEMICTTCAVTEHDGHRREKIEHSIVRHKSRLDAKMKVIKEEATKCLHRCEEMKARLDLLKYKTQQTLTSIAKDEAEKIAVVKRHYANLAAKVTAITEEETVMLEAALSAEETKQSEAQSMTSYVDNTLATTAKAMLLQEIQVKDIAQSQ